jgi:hypothetical protein
METLAQSVSTIAPTTTPAATIPLVFALAGNGTWLAYVLATVAVLSMALIAGAQRSFRALLVVRWCWLWPAIFILSPKGPMENSPTSISDISRSDSLVFSGALGSCSASLDEQISVVTDTQVHCW